MDQVTKSLESKLLAQHFKRDLFGYALCNLIAGGLCIGGIELVNQHPQEVKAFATNLLNVAIATAGQIIGK